MKLQIIKYQNDLGEDRWKIAKNGNYVSVYFKEQEAIEAFDKMVQILSQPVEPETIIKEVVI